MKTEEKRSIKSTILECREVLEKDIEQVLINYGIYVDKVWINIDDLKNLTEEQKFTRGKIENVIAKYEKGGFSKDKAVKEYIKEVSYTYLNRLAALRVMEVRGLIDEILIPRNEYGNRSFMSSRFYEVAREYCKYQMDGGLSFLLILVFKEISKEINMLFNMEDEYSLIFPSNEALLEVIQLLCNEIDEESWKQDEIIGWIYQYFNDKEKDEVFDRLYNKKEKIKVEDIPAATQLFTPDWIVDWIVDNSLGTLWQEIKEGKREYEGIEKIKLLDPCCGSGHFLVKAYDMFYQMYKEEGYNEEEIPFLILEHNIYGIDIDLRAVQLTGLILYIKTKTYLKQGGFNTNIKGKMQVNLVCADAILLNGTRLEALKEKHKDNKYVLEMIDIIYEEFEDVRLKGSLIQPEKRLRPLKEKAIEEDNKNKEAKSKRIAKKQEKNQIDMLGNFDYYDMGKSFSRADVELAESLKLIYQEAVKANDMSRQLFANEATKSVQLVNIFMEEYDVVVTNPPYLWRRNMSPKLKEFIEVNYKNWNTDLYSAFICRCLDFLHIGGKVGMITQQSFMFISSYEVMRKEILNNYYIEKVVHLGPKAFDDISGEKVNTVMFIIEKSNFQNRRSDFVRVYEEDTDGKKEVLLNTKIIDDYRYNINQFKFKNISGAPFVYWIDEYIFDIFQSNLPIRQKHKVVSGMRIGANDRFLRYFWEIDPKFIGNEWKIYNKGGGFSRFYGDYQYIIDWREEALEYYRENNSHRNEDMYFKNGITYSLITSSGFSSRIIPDNAVFDAAGPSIFCEGEDRYYICCFLNSTLVSYLLDILNSTINYTPSDTNKLPYIEPAKDIKEKMINLGNIGYQLAKCKYKYMETSSSFQNNLLREYIINTGSNFFITKVKKVLYIKNVMDLIENKLIILIDDIVFDLYGISEPLKKKIAQETNGLIYENYEIYSKLNIKSDIKTSQEEIIEYCYELVNNNDIIKELDNLFQTSINDIKNEIKDFISYYLGVAFGRWTNVNNNDGIIPINSSIYLEDDIIENIYSVFHKDFNNQSDQILEEIEKLFDKSLEDYFIRDFFKDHIKKYRKRPIYWHICSPKKTFNCFVYYHKLDKDTLYKVKGIYLREMIDRYKDDLEYYNDQLIEARLNKDKNKEKDFRARVKDLEEKLEDLYDLDKMLMEIAPSYKPDLDEGVLNNIIPVEPILSSKVSTAREIENYYKEVEKQ